MAFAPKHWQWPQWLKTARHPPKYITAALIVSLGGLLNGLDTGTIGPVTAMPSFTDSFGEISSLLLGLVVSSLLLAGTVASVFSGPLSDSLGRTRAVALGAVVFATGAALEAGAINIGMLIAGRCVVGIGEGFFLSALVVYVCEIAPPNRRGQLASVVQVFVTIGLCLGYFLCYGTVRIPSSLSWRLPLALQSAIALCLAFCAFFLLSESPRWLAFKGRKEEASRAWDKLGVSDAEREKDLLLNPTTMNDTPTPPAEVNKLGFFAKMRRDLVASIAMFGKDSRRPMLLGVFMMSMQQMSGIDGVVYYAPLLFQQAGITSSTASFLASGVSAILIFAFTVLAVLVVDKWGRRPTTIYGGLVLLACMTLMAMLYVTDSVHATYGIGRWAVIVTIFIFSIAYSTTWAMSVKLFASEIQPVNTRATATSLAQAANLITNFFVAFITPILLSKSSSAIYFLFAGCLFLTIVVGVLFMPETRGRDLETIGDAIRLQDMSNIPIVRGVKVLRNQIRRRMGAGSASGGGASEPRSPAIELQDRS